MWGRSLPFAGAMLVSVLVLFTPAPDVPPGPWWADDVVHFCLFALLAVTGSALPAPAWVLAAALVGYAALSELVQAVAPLGRSGSVFDLLADVVGIAAGIAAAAAVAWLCPRFRFTRGPAA